MSVETDICNSAVIKLGVSILINDLEDDTKEARLCKHQYPLIRDAILRSAPWSFAVRRKRLTAVDPVPARFEFINGDEFVFALPVDCVKVWKTLDPLTVKFRVEGRYIVANTNVLEMYYISKAATVDDYDAAFKEAVSNALAADLCYPLTQSITLKQSLENTAQFWIDQARSYSSQEGTPDNYSFDSFLGSRVGGHAFYD